MAPALHEAALRAVVAGASWAAANGLRVGIVVLDPSFTPVSALTMDGAYPSVFEVARAKARTALNFRASTAALAASIKPESQRALADVVPGLMFIGGGMPIHGRSSVLGAVGVSGGSADQDAACAQHVVEAVEWEEG